jgi:cysteine desulfurase/selenocysteine lyase
MAHEQQITAYALTELKKIDGLQIIGNPQNRGSIISFNLNPQLSTLNSKPPTPHSPLPTSPVHPHDAALILDEEGIAVRAGHHCAQPVMEHFGTAATLRASFAAYTDSWEIDRLCQALKRVIEIFLY